MFVRYLLWQIPAWLVTAAVGMVVVFATGVSWWIVPVTVALLAARDVMLYPAMRSTFRSAAPSQPIGAFGVCVEDTDPVGLVRVHGELWRARAAGEPVRAAQDVTVIGAQGLTLVVRRRGEPSPAR